MKAERGISLLAGAPECPSPSPRRASTRRATSTATSSTSSASALPARRLPFDQSVNPAGGGSTLVYGYTRQITQRAAAFRAFNAEYTPAEVTKAQYTVNLRPLGGSFQIDRVLTGIGAISEVALPARPAHQGDQGLLRRPGHQRRQRRDHRRLRRPVQGARRLVHRDRRRPGPRPHRPSTPRPSPSPAVQRINAWLGAHGRAARRPAHELHGQVAGSRMIAAFSGQLRSAHGRLRRPIADVPRHPARRPRREGRRLGARRRPPTAGTNEAQTRHHHRHPHRAARSP